MTWLTLLLIVVIVGAALRLLPLNVPAKPTISAVLDIVAIVLVLIAMFGSRITVH